MTTVIFSGHMVDQPDRPHPRFPPEMVPAARAAIEKAIAAVTDTDAAAVAGAACGGDLLFCDEWLRTHRPLTVFLPRAVDPFLDESVRFAGEEWVELFDRTIADIATEVVEAVPNGGGDPHIRNNVRMLEVARSGSPLVGIFLWDGTGGDGPGGTAHMVAEVERSGGRVMIVAPADL
jgi:hypothetical protein